MHLPTLPRQLCVVRGRGRFVDGALRCFVSKADRAEELVDVHRTEIVLLHKVLSDCGWGLAAVTGTQSLESKPLKPLGDESFVYRAVRRSIVLHPATLPAQGRSWRSGSTTHQRSTSRWPAWALASRSVVVSEDRVHPSRPRCGLSYASSRSGGAAERSSGQSMVTLVHGVAYRSVASTRSTHRMITVAPENGARSAALKAAEA